jgi:ABC-type antimicrobial peptide transport system permease subunit
MFVSFAFRNVLRNKRRTLLTMAGIVAGTVSILMLGGYYEYNYWVSVNRLFEANMLMYKSHHRGTGQRKNRIPMPL